MKEKNTIDYFALEISDNEFTDLQKLIVRETGILLNPAKRELIKNRLRPVLIAKELSSYGDYYKWLVNNSERRDLHELVCSITTNKTSFFRNPKQMELLKNEVVPELSKINSLTSKRKLKIWSAGCSSGEEAYSIAINCLEAKPAVNLSALSITATDIDSKILKKARIASYAPQKMKEVRQSIVDKYFMDKKNENSNTKLTLVSTVKSCVSFKEANLTTLDTWPEETFDIIFCRNVLIYMRKDYKINIIKNFYDKLNEGGYLFLGHSETLHGIDVPLSFKGHSMFRKEHVL